MKSLIKKMKAISKKITLLPEKKLTKQRKLFVIVWMLLFLACLNLFYPIISLLP